MLDDDDDGHRDRRNRPEETGGDGDRDDAAPTGRVEPDGDGVCPCGGRSSDPLHRYYASGAYDEQVRAIVREASSRLLGAIERGQLPPNAVVVFDIDDTLLNSHPHKKVEHLRLTGRALVDPRGGVPRHEQRAFLPPIRATVDLHNELRRRGVRTVLLTGRYARHERHTMANLRAAGVDPTHDRVIFREPHEECIDASSYKQGRRAALAREGWVVVANLGDQVSDVVGDHSGMAFVLPNPQYVVT